MLGYAQIARFRTFSVFSSISLKSEEQYLAPTNIFNELIFLHACEPSVIFEERLMKSVHDTDEESLLGERARNVRKPTNPKTSRVKTDEQRRMIE